MTIRKRSESQDNTDRQLKKIRKTGHDMKEKFNKEIEIFKKNQTETNKSNKKNTVESPMID